MKYWAASAVIFTALGSALVWSEMRKIDAPVGPEPLLNLVADTERELTRLPVAFAPLPDAEEIEIGKKLEKIYTPFGRQAGDEERDRAIEQYLAQVGAKVAAHAHRKLPYRFHYVPNMDFINAFALPGGPVFIGAGLMALMDSEDELAAVLGHEIEHIDHYHCAERVQVQAVLRRIPLGELAGLPLELFVAGYSKNQELEADREGTKLAAAATYSPQGAIKMFEAFERAYPTGEIRSGTPQEELSEIARKTLEGYFRSHPVNRERIDQIGKMIAGGQLPGWTHMTPFPLAYIFVTERAWRSLQAALARPDAFLNADQKKKRETGRLKQYTEAARLASQSLALKPAQPRATEILAVADFALGDYPAATAAYRTLLPDYPAFAAGVGQYARTLAQEALETEHYDQAVQLAKRSLELQANHPDTLKVLAEAQFRTFDFEGAAATCGKLKSLYPQTAEEVRTEANRLAEGYLSQHKYEAAAKLAAQSLALKPKEPEPLATLAKAQFALANFSAAAAAYRSLLDQQPSDQDFIRGYAEALSASGATLQNAREFQTWATRVEPENAALSTELRIQTAGLMLLAGNQAPANELVQESQVPEHILLTPEALGRLGWWYYRAGNYEMSHVLLLQALGARPEDPGLQAAVAWDEVQHQNLDNAIRQFTACIGDAARHSPMMGRAVARWQAHQTDSALKDFESAKKTVPEWLNPRWVNALFPKSVVETVTAMDLEWQKRQLVRR